MPTPLSYLTVRAEACAEITERRSRFICTVKPVDTEGSAQELISECTRRYRGASHNVYAYILRSGQIRRFSDDGEPQGTAGMPVLEVLSGMELTDCACVVTRYFGGILLGTGGLVHAYSRAASAAVDAAGMVRMRLCGMMRLECDYARYGRVAPLITENGGTVTDTQFAELVRLGFAIPRENAGRFCAALTELSAGGLSTNIDGEQYFPYSEQD